MSATLGASNYTYACATPRQTADWIGAQVQALEFIGGVPRLIVPDQTRALIKTRLRVEESLELGQCSFRVACPLFDPFSGTS
jgi:transposase